MDTHPVNHQIKSAKLRPLAIEQGGGRTVLRMLDSEDTLVKVHLHITVWCHCLQENLPQLQSTRRESYLLDRRERRTIKQHSQRLGLTLVALRTRLGTTVEAASGET
eukprot:m.118075 g.118075  ORF g.118075 m.118075 type:complete len:107 (-) comp13221_c0_seq4:336-656(-)